MKATDYCSREFVSTSDNSSLQKFISFYPCLPAPSRPNTFPCFQVANASNPPLQNSPSTFRPSAWAELLRQYPGPLKIHLPMILRFGAEIGYQGPFDIFLISKNLTSSMEAPDIIDQKLKNDLVLRRVVQVVNPQPPYIASPLGLVRKHDGGWRRIHHLSHPHIHSVNDNIPKESSQLQYIKFQEILDLILSVGQGCIIIKGDIKDAFRNIPVASRYHGLLGFCWKGLFYKETCLPFGLATASILFNLFGEAFHWILESYFQWTVGHYLDDFVSVFPSTTTTEQIEQQSSAYNWLTDILGIPRNESKNLEGSIIPILGIEVDTNSFTASLPQEKLDQAKVRTTKILTDLSDSVAFFDIQSLVGFLSFCSQAVRLGRVFMRRLWDFVHQFPLAAVRSTRRRIPSWVREDLEWWNQLLPNFNGVLFFDTHNRTTIQACTDACLYGLGGFFFSEPGSWNQNEIIQINAFQAHIQHGKFSINVYEVEAILLLFQLWGPTWHRHKVILYTDSVTACSGLSDTTLKGPANAPLREIFLIAAKWDIVIEPLWIEGKTNGLADALSRFDKSKIADLCPNWQNPFNSMIRPPPIYPQPLVPP